MCIRDRTYTTHNTMIAEVSCYQAHQHTYMSTRKRDEYQYSHVETHECAIFYKQIKKIKMVTSLDAFAKLEINNILPRPSLYDQSSCPGFAFLSSPSSSLLL
eukprot:TRINITY_DN5381_c0_g1_i3.p3 TRINITY_DN5381_c0_g1~~TRINITY_DN5381_c0_g1_i3.p3  ORF type:complete len:102 (-),score=0.02 TRINITY_DN5381_c0_g1_i3:140-445(-)